MLTATKPLNLAMILFLMLPISAVWADLTVVEVSQVPEITEKKIEGALSPADKKLKTAAQMTSDQFLMGEGTPFAEEDDFWEMPEDEAVSSEPEVRAYSQEPDVLEKIEVVDAKRLIEKEVEREFMVAEPSVESLDLRDQSRLLGKTELERAGLSLNLDPRLFFTPLYYETGESLDASFRDFKLN